MTTKIKLANNVADVDLTTAAPTNGQGLIYNSTSSKWIPGAAAGGGVTVYSTIDDLPLSGVSTGDLALVDSTNKLYLWMDTGWYNIATINTDPQITGGYDASYLLATDATGETPPTGGGTATIITLVASDPEGIPLTWTYEITSGSLGSGSSTVATVSNVDNVFTITPYRTEGEFAVTFKASDGVNLATAVSSFTLLFAVFNSRYTSLLVKTGATGANSTFTDSSDYAHAVDVTSAPNQGSFSPYRDNGFTGAFVGDGGLSTPASTPLTLGTGDFTMEAWINTTSVAASQGIFDGRNASNGPQLYFAINTSGNILWWVNGATATSGGTITVNTWHHVAAVRSSGTLRLFIDGSQVGSDVADSVDYAINSTLKIATSTTNDHFNGSVRDVRIVKGTALYTGSGASAFTPDPRMSLVSGTSLLLFAPYAFDTSGNSGVISYAGSSAATVNTDIDREIYTAAAFGGSAYFNAANSNRLKITQTTDIDISNTDFTIEAWIYPPSTGGGTFFSVSLDANLSSATQLCFNMWTSGTIFTFRPYQSSSDYSTNTGGLILNAWNHVAVTRSGNTFTAYVNGKTGTTRTLSGALNYDPTWKTNIGGIVVGSFSGYTGYVSDLRITKNSVLYTADFVPNSTPLTSTAATGLLMHFEDANVYDAAQVSDLSLVGNTAASATQTKYAARSVYFDGTGGYCTVPASPNFAFGTGDFTVEAWVYSPDNTRKSLLESRSAPTSTAGYAFICEDYIRFYSKGFKISSSAMPTNQWAHIAWVRENGTLYFYLNGQQDATTYALTNNFTDPLTYAPKIGGSSTAGEEWVGYIEDLRITKGLARYTANFTPPTSELLG